MAYSKFYKWFNLALFLVLDVVIVFVCSLIPENLFFLLEQSGSNITIVPNPVNFLAGLLIIVTLQVVYYYYRLVKLVRDEEMFRIYPPVDDVEQLSTSKVPIDEVNTVVDETGAKLGVRVKAVFVSRQTIPKLFSFDVIPFLRIFSVLVLSENAMEITSKKELRCLIAHEMGHVKNNNSAIRLLQLIAWPFIFIAYLYPFILIFRELFQFIDPFLFTFNPVKVFIYVLILLTLVVTVLVLTKIHVYFIDTANKHAVFLADRTAVEIESKNAAINMLVKLGQRSEAMDILYEKIMWLEKREKKKDYQIDLKQVLGILDLFPKGEISEHTARKMAPEIYLKSRFLVLEKFYQCKIPEDVQAGAIKEASDYLIKLHDEEIAADAVKKKEMEKRAERTIDWREVDKNGNLDLDDGEIKEFIEMLKKEPTKLLFENEFAREALFKNYPSFRDRILYLVENASKKPGQPAVEPGKTPEE